MQSRNKTPVAIVFGILCAAAVPAGGSFAEPSAERGYRLLLETAYLPVAQSDFDQATFDELWKTWPQPLRTQAEQASPEQRRKMAFQRYGLTPRPAEASGRPLQYVVDEQGNWTMNCFACHSGQIRGQVVPGLPNARYALTTLTEEIRITKLRLGKRLTRMDIGSLAMPLGDTVGTTNAVMFGVALMAFRDAELNVVRNNAFPKLVHHDMDAPPWWHFRKRRRLYIDGFAEKGARALMQFLLVKENGPDVFRRYEQDFQDIYAYLESVSAPPYPFPINQELAQAGRDIFSNSCARCHGTYGENESYPERRIPIDQIGTDPVRLAALSPEHRRNYGRSWFAHYGQQETIEEPGGYVAPPLDGIWASAPYFHNGSVPTLWHVLYPDQRPRVWKPQGEQYDQQRVGLNVIESEDLPTTMLDRHTRREYFDTRAFGKSAAGHRFPGELSEHEKLAVLEYLKTL